MPKPITADDLRRVLRAVPKDATFICRSDVLYVFDKNGKGLLEIDPRDRDEGVRPYSG